MRHQSFLAPNSLVSSASEIDSLKRFWAVVVGCATYRIGGDRHMHQTPFIFQLYRWLPEHPNAQTSFQYERGAIYPATTLRFREMYSIQNEPY
jgi:hypothetical protein